MGARVSDVFLLRIQIFNKKNLGGGIGAGVSEFFNRNRNLKYFFGGGYRGARVREKFLERIQIVIYIF